MLYTEFLKTNRSCPFCEQTNKIIENEDEAFLTYAIAPYHKHHLLVIPHRHIETFQDLNEKETKAIEKLLHKGVALLKALKYKDYTILVKNGELGKSIPHLHYHIVPAVIIGDLDHKGDERKIMTEEEINQLFEELEKIKPQH